MGINERITQLRKEMKELGLNAYVIPSSDPHLSEEVSDHWMGRMYFSGFTGSAGTLVVTETESGLWTDGRYFIQAETQLAPTEIKLFKMGQPNVPTLIDYLLLELSPGDCVGFDGHVLSAYQVNQMKQIFSQKGIDICGDYDIVETIWTNRPAIPNSDVFIHEVKYTGFSCAEKIKKVRDELVEKEVDGVVLTELGCIAWVFNIRGDDISFNPMVISYGFITKEEAYLFVEPSRLSKSVMKYLEKNGVCVKPYDAIDEVIQEVCNPIKVLCHAHTINAYLYEVLSSNEWITVIEGTDIVNELKAIKNDVEVANIREAQIKDGCALVEAMQFIYERLENNETVTEYDVADILEFSRRKQILNYGSSFMPIIGYKENAAMMHYRPTKEMNHELKQEGFLLIDSGGQYLDGTTDITRTFVLGPTTDEENRHFTLVLKAHIGLSRAIFQEGCTGGNLDILSRFHLWTHGLDYRCGTGHGVAYFGAVHEGPQGFGLRSSIPLKKGMMLTNEPGIYEEGRHGVRIENTLLVVEDQKTEYGQFYRFEVVSYFPIETRALVLELLSDDEVSWLNNYHQMVREQLIPRLNGKSLDWLLTRTELIKREF